MNVPTRLGAFVVAVCVVFAGAYGVGAVVGPIRGSGPPPHETAGGHAEASGESEPAGTHGGGHDTGEAAASGPGGLAVSADGYALHPIRATLTAGSRGEFAFQILDADRHPVTAFQLSHEKRLHLIVVRRDLTGFQHVHPQMVTDGTWRTPLRLTEAGDWRVFADFLPEGRQRQVILGVDVPVGGDYRPVPLPEPATATTVDGYTVAVDGHLAAGRASRVTLTLSRNGAPVTDLQPYLGAYGHLVALRAGDLGYLHVHPQQTDKAGPKISFDVEVATPGAYRLFLDFQHGGAVRTASFTAVAEET